MTLTCRVFLEVENINNSMMTHLKKYFCAAYELVSKKEVMVKSYFKHFSLKAFDLIFLGKLGTRRSEIFLNTECTC